MMNNGIIHLLLLLLLWLHLSSLCLFSNLLLLLPILPILRRTLLKIHPKTRRKNDHSARVIACVDSVFHDLELQLNDLLPQFDLQLFHFDLARHKLEKIKAFVVVSGTQLDHMDVAKLASFWLRIETTVSKYGNQIRPLLRYSYFNRNLPDSHKNIIFEFLAEISSLEGETAEWYVTMADSLYLRQQSVVISCSSLVTTDEVLTIMSFSFEILDSLRQSELTVQGEALVEQMTFLQSLIRFVGDDTQDLLIQEFLVHVKVLAVQIHVLFMCPEALDGELEEESLSDDDDDDDERPNDIVLTLLQKIKPTDNFVYQAYTQALISSKLSRQSLAPNDLDMDPDAFKATKNFLDSIISYLWEILLGNCVHPFSIKDQLQELYGGLKTLRTTIKQQQLPNKLANNIGIVLCDAGALVFSLYQRHRGPDLGLLQELLKTIKATLVQLGVKDPQSPVFYFQKTNQLDFVDSVLEQLTELTGRGDKQPRNRSHCLLVLNDKLVSFRSFLGDIVELRHQYVEFQTLWDRVLEVAYRVEGLVGQLLVDDHQDSFSSSLVSTMKDIQGIQAEIEVKRSEIKVKRQELTEVTETCNLLPSSQKPLLPTTNEFVGFMDDARSVLDRLTRGSAHLQIIAIVGMPGMGKTTLATKIYNDYYVSCFFSVRAWSQISQTVDRKKILGNLINQVDPNNKYPELGEQDLVQILWRKLKGKRYLILLDDIWDNEAWKILAASFPDDNAKSRILLTSRHSDVAPREMMVDQKPYALRPLNEEESIELLQKKLFKENVGWHPTFRAFGSKIAERCRGVPLMIIIVAGILENTAPEGWKGVLDDLNSGNLSITDHCRRTLDLSYECLPDDLRQCFLYFRAFPEDEEIPAKRLFYLWTAEGFFRRDKDERMEDIAEEYLNSLIGRNLIVVAKRRWDGGVKACRIHDLLREFCLHKASEEHFLHVLKGYDDLLAFNEPYGLQRLSIHSEVHHLKESKLFCPRVRSLLFHSSEKKRREISLRIHSFKHLRVLDLEQCPLKVSFSRELELLVQLTFLAIHCEFGNRSVSSI
ncbi:OLC1v1012454C1 [Oldenlandia corymbosa var. corymbosa]|nr:OLC1v1012454C1 [Oldenlandia corymbosa var. corymbosa]